MKLINTSSKYLNYVAKNMLPKRINTSIISNKVNDLLENPKIINSFINGKEITSNVYPMEFKSPINNSKTIYYYNYNNIMDTSFKNYYDIKNMWQKEPIDNKIEIFLKAADLIENEYFYDMMAATIVNQGKNSYEAEIDCVQELCDFLRFNVQYTINILENQPISPTNNINNYSQYIPLRGFVSSITPFNFTAIAGNLASAPLLFGNINYWKPSEKSLLSNKLFYDILLEANLPPEVLSFCVTEPTHFINTSLENDVGAILYTGSSSVFKQINDKTYQKYYHRFSEGESYNHIRLMGETGGKNFHWIDTYCNLDEASLKTAESAFNYSGQKCSACSRAYIHQDFLDIFTEKLITHINNMFSTKNPYGLICENSYKKTNDVIKSLQQDPEIEFVFGGYNSDKSNYYIQPTIVICKNPNHNVFNEEFFAPILAIYPYNDKQEGIDACLNSTNYALTGAVFSDNTKFIEEANAIFENSCGNFYINDKSTGAVVGQQPFGGFGISGTNDKAGDVSYMRRLCQQRNIKYTFN